MKLATFTVNFQAFYTRLLTDRRIEQWAKLCTGIFVGFQCSVIFTYFFIFTYLKKIKNYYLNTRIKRTFKIFSILRIHFIYFNILIIYITSDAIRNFFLKGPSIKKIYSMKFKIVMYNIS